MSSEPSKWVQEDLRKEGFSPDPDKPGTWTKREENGQLSRTYVEGDYSQGHYEVSPRKH